jgi:hypothetical protein
MAATLSNQPHRGDAVIAAKSGCDICAVAPAHPTPIPEIVAALRNVEDLQGLGEDEYSGSPLTAVSASRPTGRSSSAKTNLLTISTSSSRVKSTFIEEIQARYRCSSVVQGRSPASYPFRG